MAEQTIYLSLGSNLGDRAANLRQGISALPRAGVHVTRASSLYETEPVDFLEQDWFLNCVVQGTTEDAALELLRQLRDIEARMGSKKLMPKGPRLLDIDILFYGSETIDAAELQVPHPRMTQRRFVLVPLAEINPQLRHPVSGCTVQQLLERTEDRSQVRRI